MNKKWQPVTMAALSALGLASSLYLTSIHLAHLRTGAASICNLGSQLNCDLVNTSRYSELAGIPVSHLGSLLYVALLLASLLAGRRPGFRARCQPYLLFLVGIAVLFSLFLAGISAFVLHAFCVFCVSLYVINFALLFVLIPGVGPTLRALPAQLADDLRTLLQPAPLLLSIGALIGAAGSLVLVRGATQNAQLLAAQRSSTGTAEAPPAAATPESAAKPATPEPPARIDLFDASAPSLGPADAPVTIVEISDFECPYCQKAAQTLAELRKLYPGKLRLVFRNFPLDESCNKLLKRQIHENACGAARAAFCAGEQGQFWPYAEKLFAGDTEPSDLEAHARSLGLKDAIFRRCLRDEATNARILRDIDECAKAGVVGVPVLLVNGRKLAGAQPIEAFRKLIDEELAIAGKEVR